MFLIREYISQLCCIHKIPKILVTYNRLHFILVAADAVSLLDFICLCSMFLIPGPRLRNNCQYGMYHFHGRKQKLKNRKSLTVPPKASERW